MSELIVVRHGQASFLSDDYDKLSALGREQSRHLGRYWASQELIPTHMIVGPRRRQQETADALRETLSAASISLPELIRDDRLDEFDWDGLKRYADSTLSRQDTKVAAHKKAFESADSPVAKRREIQHYMEAIMARWVEGSFHEDGLETWAEFCSRVEVAIHAHMAETPRGSRVALFTSGGVAAVAAGRVLGLTAPKMVGLIWTLRNSATVEFLYHGDRISMSAFNSAPHLPDRADWTYR